MYQKSTVNVEDNYKDLASAICKTSIEDYKKAAIKYSRVYKTAQQLIAKEQSGVKLSDDEEKIMKTYLTNQGVLKGVETFFLDSWGETLSGLAGNSVMAVLKEQVREELKKNNLEVLEMFEDKKERR